MPGETDLVQVNVSHENVWFRGAQWAGSVTGACVTLDLGVVSLSPTLGVEMT